jgi:hypothetical protein
MKYLISLILILAPINAYAAKRRHPPGAPVVFDQEYAGELTQDAAQNFTGTISDLYSCGHQFSINTAQIPWVVTMPYADSCGDPSPNDIAEQINLWPNVQTGATFSGTYEHVPDCYFDSGAGSFVLTKEPSGVWLFQLRGVRTIIRFCR